MKSSKIPQLLSEKAAARHLAVSERTLQGWRAGGKGPRYITIGSRTVRYAESDLIDWIDANRKRGTIGRISEASSDD